MTDENGGAAAEVETTPSAAPEAVVSSPGERDYEADARKDGWRPKDEWTGDPDKWKDAKAFVEYGDIETRVEARVRKEFEGRFAKLEKVSTKTIAKIQADTQAEIARLKAERREAVKAGDVEAVEAYDARIETKQNAKDDVDADAEFKSRNEWYGDDDVLTSWAQTTSQKIVKEYYADKGVQMPLEEMYAEVERRTKARFPEKFGGAKKTAANGHAAVDGGSDNGPAKADPLSKLPAEARAQAREDMKRYPKMYPDAASWIKAYNG
jgi:hypothetical protein